MRIDYDMNRSDKSYPYQLIVKESSFAEDIEEYGTSVTTLERIIWYIDGGVFETPFDFETPITSDITLYGYINDSNNNE